MIIVSPGNSPSNSNSCSTFRVGWFIDSIPCRVASASTTGFFPGGSGRQRIIVLIVAVCIPEAVAFGPDMAEQPMYRWSLDLSLSIYLVYVKQRGAQPPRRFPRSPNPAPAYPRPFVADCNGAVI